MKSSHPRATSLIFILIIVTIMIVVAGALATSFLRAAGRTNDLFRSTQAYYAARAAIEKAINNASPEDVGYENADLAAIDWDSNLDGTDDISGEYEIYSRARQMDSDWSACGLGDNCYIPIPGSGTGGDDCDFTDLNADWVGDEDHACNWNRIYAGDNVTIPFFYVDALNTVWNPADMGMASLEIRFRVPDGYSALDQSSDDIVLYWEFTGECDDGSGPYTCSFVPFEEGDPFNDETQIHDSDVNNPGIETLPITLNTEGRKNAKTPKELQEFLLVASIDRPNLHLSTLAPFQTNDISSETLPYLEYQLYVNGPISDSKILYSARGEAEGKIGTYIRDIQASQSIESSSVIHFVLQN